MNAVTTAADRLEGLIYARHDGAELAGDLYLPAGRGPHPALLLLSGGGWRRGQRSALRQWGEYLSRAGYAAFCVDYRQATQGKAFPHAAQDVVAAAQYLYGEAGEHGIDRSRIGVLGVSAGAHLGALACLAGASHFSGAYPDDPYAELRPTFNVLIAVYGIYDLFAHWQQTRNGNAAPGEDITERFMGGAPFDDPSLYTLASPLRHVAYQHNKLKVLLIWGAQDTAVDPSQSQAFRTALEQARFFVRAWPVLGAGHFWFSEDPIHDPSGFTHAVAPRILRFLERV